MNESTCAIRIRALQTQPVKTQPVRAQPGCGGERFEALLEKAVYDKRGVKFSAHAQTRLNGRGINLSEADHERIERGAETARAKGSREALLVMDHIGLIYNVKNQTVLTALDIDEMNSRVVTNIDSAVFL